MTLLNLTDSKPIRTIENSNAQASDGAHIYWGAVIQRQTGMDLYGKERVAQHSALYGRMKEQKADEVVL